MIAISDELIRSMVLCIVFQVDIGTLQDEINREARGMLCDAREACARRIYDYKKWDSSIYQSMQVAADRGRDAFALYRCFPCAVVR